MHKRSTALLDALESRAGTSIEQIDILPPTNARCCWNFNDTAAPFAEHRCIHQLFEEQATAPQMRSRSCRADSR